SGGASCATARPRARGPDRATPPARLRARRSLLREDDPVVGDLLVQRRPGDAEGAGGLALLVPAELERALDGPLLDRRHRELGGVERRGVPERQEVDVELLVRREDHG